MIADHILCKGTDLVVLAFLQGLLSSLNIDLVSRIGDMRNLRVIEFAALGASNPGRQR